MIFFLAFGLFYFIAGLVGLIGGASGKEGTAAVCCLLAGLFTLGGIGLHIAFMNRTHEPT